MTTLPKVEYHETEGFLKDLKRLLKKFRTLEEDIETAKRNAIELYHIHKLDNRSIFPIPDFCTTELQILKIRKFACKSLKGQGSQSGIRIIYAYHTSSVPKVEFIEIYFKGDKKNEDRERIKQYLKSLEI